MSDERVEWEIELEKRKILQESMITDIQKDRFIKEIESGLGEKIIEEPNKIQKKPGLFSKLKKMFLNG
jgi:lipase chaperone LimK